MATKKTVRNKRTGGPKPKPTATAKKAAACKPKRDTSKAKIVRLMRKFERDAKEKPDFHMSVSDYLRLLQVKRDLEEQPASVEVTWVETTDEQLRGG